MQQTHAFISAIARRVLTPDERRNDDLSSLLSDSERLSPRELLRDQLLQVQAVLEHAYSAVPYYWQMQGATFRPVARLPLGQLDLAQFQQLPILTRTELQEHAQLFRPQRVHPLHRPVGRTTTSGSTGQPLITERSLAIGSVFEAIRRRFHRWHRRDLNAKAAFIVAVEKKGDAEPPAGRRGGPWAPDEGTGEGVALTIRAPISAQLDWVARENPTYLSTYPSNALALLELAREKGIKVPNLSEITVSSEPISGELRTLAREVWGARVTATYSASEVGAIALQGPDSDDYLVIGENVLLEIVDEAGKPCAPGQAGRVVVTTLQDYWRPLIRYAVGDYAELGAALDQDPPNYKPGDRGLPPLRRVLGRERNMVKLPNGDTTWPFFEFGPLLAKGNVRKWQLIQTSLSEIEVRVVSKQELAEDDIRAITAVVLEFLPVEFRLKIVRVDSIERAVNGKYEEFVCRVK
jgi:phenylacetate-CoA ligase